MIEILPIKLIVEEDGPIFGPDALSLGKLARLGFEVGNGVVITAPKLHLKTALEHYDFGTREVFEQSLTLVKKDIASIPIPSDLKKEIGKHSHFLLNGESLKGIKNLWHSLLIYWVEEIKERLWRDGFYIGITQDLTPQIVIFIKKIEGFGKAYFDSILDDTVINTKAGTLYPRDMKKLDEIVRAANKKLFIPHEYEWIVDRGVKITKVLPYTPSPLIQSESRGSEDLSGMRDSNQMRDSSSSVQNDKQRSAVKVFLDLSGGLVVENEVDGVYIASEKIFDLNKPADSFENLVFKIVESAITFPNNPVLVKLADMSEGMGKIRGALRLLHQRSLFDPIAEALDFARHKKSLTNVHVVIPFVRGVNELMQIKRELAVKKLSRKNSLQIWMEICVPENIINLEEYLMVGLDGVILNLDELIAHLNGFDSTQEDLMFYKNEVSGLLKFLEDGLKFLHKSKIPFIAFGSLSSHPDVLEFLIEKGVYGVVVERYEAHSAYDLLRQTEKRVVLARS